ncbi:MAG: hypothetical protein ACE3L7_23325 [Candidatus Pristimantibacillus sp.]
MDGYLDGKPLSAKLWRTAAVPTLVRKYRESACDLRWHIGADQIAPRFATSTNKGIEQTKNLKQVGIQEIRS